MKCYKDVLEHLHEVGVLHPVAEEAAVLISLDKREEAYGLLHAQGYSIDKFDTPTQEWMWEC